MNKYTLVLMLFLYVILLTVFPDDSHVLISKLDVNVLGIAISLLSTIILIEICKLIPHLKLLDYIGKNTLGLYFMSGALPIVLSMALHKLFPVNYLGLIIVFIGSLSVAIVAVSLLNKFTPWLFDLRLLWKNRSNENNK